MTILVDMDDTIEALTPAWCAWLNKRHGTKVDPEDITDWDISTFFPKLSEKQVFAPLSDEKFWETVKPKKDAAKYLKMLMERGHQVYIVTSSWYTTIQQKTEKMLLKYFPFIPWQNVIITYAKHMIKGDFLIDDAPHNLLNSDCKRLLVDMPHNRWFQEKPHGIRRVYSWDEIYKILCDYEENG